MVRILGAMEQNDFAVAGASAIEARERLTALARLPDHDTKRMAQIGTAAIFEEALLSALKAHLLEVKMVAR